MYLESFFTYAPIGVIFNYEGCAQGVAEEQRIGPEAISKSRKSVKGVASLVFVKVYETGDLARSSSRFQLEKTRGARISRKSAEGAIHISLG
jgi:hypothetical protein